MERMSHRPTRIDMAIKSKQGEETSHSFFGRKKKKKGKEASKRLVRIELGFVRLVNRDCRWHIHPNPKWNPQSEEERQ